MALGLVPLGRAWLTGRQDHAGWGCVWETCFKKRCREVDFLMAGYQWVLGHAHLPETIGLAENLLAAAEHGDWNAPREMIEWVQVWLRANPQNRGWSYSWQRLWDVDPSQEAAVLVLGWLEFNPPERSIFWVTRKFLNSGKPQVGEMLRVWADARPGCPQAATIYSVLNSDATP